MKLNYKKAVKRLERFEKKYSYKLKDLEKDLILSWKTYRVRPESFNISLEEIRRGVRLQKNVKPFVMKFLKESKKWPEDVWLLVTNTSIGAYVDQFGRMVSLDGRSIPGTEQLVTKWRNRKK